MPEHKSDQQFDGIKRSSTSARWCAQTTSHPWESRHLEILHLPPSSLKFLNGPLVTGSILVAWVAIHRQGASISRVYYCQKHHSKVEKVEPSTLETFGGRGRWGGTRETRRQEAGGRRAPGEIWTLGQPASSLSRALAGRGHRHRQLPPPRAPPGSPRPCPRKIEPAAHPPAAAAAPAWEQRALASGDGGAQHLRLGICSTVRLPCHTERSWWAIVYRPENYRRPTAPRPQPPPPQRREPDCTKRLHTHTIRLTPWASGKGDTTGGRGGGQCQTRGKKTGKPGNTCISDDRGRGRRRQAGTGCPLPGGFTPKPGRSHTRRPADPGEEGGIREEAPAAAPRAGKRMLPGTSPCCELALSSKLLLETQPGSANSPLSGAAARAAVWSGPLSSLRQARSPHLHLPPRALLSFTPLASPLPPPAPFFIFFLSLSHLLLSHLPLSGSELQSSPDATLGWRQKMR